jgi:murein DD-endopeptidase MepM/ murein hydrolase activator NlpD
MTGLGDILTYTDPNKTKPDGTPNELYGLSATDSYGVKAATYGDTGTPPAYAKANSLESSGVLGALTTLAFFASGSPAVRETAHNMCKTTENPLALVAQCAAPAFATGPFAPLAGIVCIASNLAIGFIITETLKVIGPIVLAEIIKANVNPLNENTKGVLAGDALYPGAAVTLVAHAASYGLTPGSKDEISTYVALGEDVRKQDEAIARIEAKETPFDAYNKYSFLGSLVNNLKISSYANSSLSSTANTLVSTIPLSLASLTSTSNAGTYMPLSNTKAAQYGSTDCPDVKAATGDPNAACCPALKAIGGDGDHYCIESGIMSSVELNADAIGNKEWMVANGYVEDATGAAVKGTEPGRQFQLYIDNCLNRVDPWGETTKSISEGEAGDYEWFIGAKCKEKTDMLYNFRTYGADEPIIAVTGGEESALLPTGSTTSQTGSVGTGENSGSVNPNGWAFPTTAGAPLTQGYHEGHLALDIGSDPNASSVPIYAMRDGVVTSVGNMPPPYQVACPSPTGTIQQAVTIEHMVDGQKYISAYHHVEAGQFPFSVGSTVKAGDRIATMGNTGCSFGRHLHVELWKNQIYGGGASVDLGAILY